MRLKKLFHVIIAASVIRTPEHTNDLIKSGNQDFIALGRPLLVDPYWHEKAKK